MDNDKTKFSTKGLTQIIALIALIGTVFLANAQSFMFIEADDEHNISSRSISANGEYIAIYMYPKGGSSYDGSEYIIKLNEPEVMYGPLEENCSMQEWSPVTDNGALFGIMYENGNTLKWFGLGEPSFSDENVPYIKLIRSFEGNENPQNCGSGNIIVGIEKDNNGNSRPVIWKPETPGEELPPLKESSAERFFGNANFVNNDGSRILGGLLGYRWIHYVVWTSDGSGYVASLLMDKYVESPWDEEDVKKPYKQF